VSTESDNNTSAASRIRAVSAGGVGVVLEWFDYGIYGTLAPIISKIFFPAEDPIISILLTLLVFGVGFVSRPIGSAVFGYIGDKYGRKVALSWTIIIMRSEERRVIAPILLTCCRLIQGLSAGGEWGGATAFLVEYATENTRGFYGSFQQNLAVVGLTIGTLLGFVMTNYFGDVVYSWGWRIPFLLGIVLGFVGWYIRVKLSDTPSFEKVEQKDEILDNPLKESLNKDNILGIIKVMGISLGWNAGFYILMTFMSSYTTTILKLPLKTSLLACLFSFILFMILMPVMGHISDRIGRKPVLITGCLGFMIFTYPVFLFMSSGSFVHVLLGEFVIAFFQSMFSGVAVAFVAEVFKTQVRVSSLVGYNIAACLSGGMGPFFATYIIKATGNIASPAFYLIGLVIFTLVAVATLPETYNKPLQ
jgi:MHS family proline/betaine transporter-like MFS transporter